MTIATVFVVDDDPSVRRALGRLLAAEGLEPLTFESAAAFLAAHDPLTPGCLVLDLAMPGLDGIALQRMLAGADCLRQIVFLTGHGDISSTVRAMQGGAVDFLTKPVDDAALLLAVRQALELDGVARAAWHARQTLARRLAHLTPREREVLAHVVAGHLNKQIAAELGTVEKTIKVHRGRVMQKMAVGSLADLVRVAERLGVEPAGMAGQPEASDNDSAGRTQPPGQLATNGR